MEEYRAWASWRSQKSMTLTLLGICISWIPCLGNCVTNYVTTSLTCLTLALNISPAFLILPLTQFPVPKSGWDYCQQNLSYERVKNGPKSHYTDFSIRNIHLYVSPFAQYLFCLVFSPYLCFFYVFLFFFVTDFLLSPWLPPYHKHRNTHTTHPGAHHTWWCTPRTCSTHLLTIKHKKGT